MGGIPMTAQLLALLSGTAQQQQPRLGANVPPPYVIKYLSGNSGTGLGNQGSLATAQDPRFLTNVGL